MRIPEKTSFVIGVVMAIIFLIILGLMFSPLFKGENAFEAADRLFNSMAKGSTYYIPRIMKENDRYQGRTVEATVAFKDPTVADQVRRLLAGTGASVSGAGQTFKVSGDLGKIVGAALADADAMFHDRGEEVDKRYGFPGKNAMVDWWTLFKEMGKSLTKQKLFKEAAFFGEVNEKAIEVGYNFYGIEPMKAAGNLGILGFALVFYILYTLWWGFAIFYIFEGLGLKMKAGAKKEV